MFLSLHTIIIFFHCSCFGTFSSIMTVTIYVRKSSSFQFTSKVQYQTEVEGTQRSMRKTLPFTCSSA